MIDNSGQAMRLMSKLEATLPLFARLSPELAAVVREKSPALELPERCRVDRIDYAGDEGGIVCWLDLGDRSQSQKFLASITHLIFDRKQPLAREITAYQKHRVKRLKQISPH